MVDLIKEPFHFVPSIWEQEFVWDRHIEFIGDSLIVSVFGGVIYVMNR